MFTNLCKYVHIFWSIQKIMSYNSTQFVWFVMSVNLHVVTSDSDEYTATISNTGVHSALPNASVLRMNVLFILTHIERIFLLIKTLIFMYIVVLPK